VRVNLLVFLGFYVTTLRVPALLMLGYWFLLQLLGGIPSTRSAEGGVAFWAHVGGFVAGLVLVLPFRLPSRAGRRPAGSSGDGRWF
jgi:membrane associated rhomboid family serine protease